MGEEDLLKREISICRTLMASKHEHIVDIIDVVEELQCTKCKEPVAKDTAQCCGGNNFAWRDSSSVFIVMEYLQGGDLFNTMNDLIAQKSAFSEHTVAELAFQVA